MKAALILGVSLALTVPPAVLAQGTVESPAHTPKSGNNAGTGSEDRGSTGWTGGNREQMKNETTGSGGADDQPQMGSGADLNGPPVQFPANKTPE